VKAFYSPPALSASGGFAKVAEFAEKIFFFSAERAENKKIYALVLSKKQSRVFKCKCSYKIVLQP
jgi:hypothetical protein